MRSKKMLKLLVIFNVVLFAYSEPIINLDPDYTPPEVELGEFNFLVSIGRMNHNGQVLAFRTGHFCGGSLLTSKHVITAAHCFVGEVPNNVRVLANFVRFTDASLEYGVEKWIRYVDWPKRRDTEDDHDIAILTLKTPANDPSIGTISWYPNYIDKNKNNTQILSLGWGKTEKYVTSPVLLKTELNIVPRRDCEKSLEEDSGEPMGINVQHMCTRSPHKVSLGSGDSGGPLILIENNTKYIIATNEAYCEKSCTFVNTHSRVSYYRDFIKDITESK